MKRSFFIKAAMLAVAMTLGAAIPVHADNNGSSGTELRTKLAGGAIQGVTPEGSARLRSSSRRMQLTVEAEHVNLPVGTSLTVDVSHAGAGTTIGTIKIVASGESELELDTRNGDTVPALVKGDIVSVSAGGTTILTGAF